LILRHFLFQNSVVFVGVGATFFAHGLGVTLLCYYLGIIQILIRGSPKKKFAVKEGGLAHCRRFADNGSGVQMRISELFVKKTRFYVVTA